MGCNCGKRTWEVVTSEQAEEARRQRELDLRIAEEQAKVAEPRRA
jgi:hypothetical protein